MAGIVLGLVFSFVMIVCINEYEESSFRNILYPWLIALIVAVWVFFMLWLLLRKPSAKKIQTRGIEHLPESISELIDKIIDAMKYRHSVRADVRQELADHFIDALADCETDDEKQKVTKELIEEFGDIKLLGKLLRRAKKRCRPLWRTVVARTFQLIGILFFLLLLRVGYMATGRPTISIDYTQWMNDKVCDSRDESLNAYYDYQKAIESIPEAYPDEIKKIDTYTRKQGKTTEDWTAIESFLKIHTEAFNTFRVGAAKPYYWNIYQVPEELYREDWQRKIEKERSIKPFGGFTKSEMVTGVMEGLMPQMQGYKKLAYRMMYFQIPFDIHKGHVKQATEDCIGIYYFSQHLLSQGVAIEQLVGVAIESIAMSSVYDLLSQVDVPPDDLLRLQQIVAKDYKPDTAPMDWSLEKAFWYDQIQRSFTDDGQGSGRPLPRGILFCVSDRKDYVTGLVTGFPDRKETIANIDRSFDRFDAYRSIKPKTLDEMEGQNLLQADKLTLMQQISEPAIQKTITIGWRVRSGQAGLIGTLSILRFEKETGRWPHNWDELLEKGYLKTIPMDPYSDAPLVYKKTEDSFTLYSIGLNFTDDGGTPGTDKNGKKRQWGEHGDRIFWPVDFQ